MSDRRIEFILGKDVITTTRKLRAVDIQISMLDYKYVEKCTDVPALKEVLRVLVSGKEGRYPDLEEAVVDKILSLLPEKERKKVLSMSSSISPQEAENEVEALNGWLQNIQLTNRGVDQQTCIAQEESNNSTSNIKDKIFESKEENSNSMQYPPVRSQTKKIREAASNKSTGKDSNRSSVQHEEKQKDASNIIPRISKEAYSNRDYFRAWDKFDYDTAEKRIDDEDDDTDIEKSRASKYQSSSQSDKWKTNVQRQASFDLKHIQNLQREMQASKLSINERKFLASREKDKGNEYFKNKDFEQSFNCYSKSLALYDQNATVYANRAMVCIRLSNLCQAISDCTQALMINPDYTKALARRGMVHHKCGRYLEAKIDFKSCINQEPGNEEYKQLLSKSEEKHTEVSGIEKHQKRKKKIVIIQEDDSDSESDDDAIEEIYTPGVIMSK